MTQPTKADRYRQVKELLDQALDLEATERSAFLERSAGDDSELLQEVQSLLEGAEAVDEGFISEPVIPRHEDSDEPPVDRQEIGPYRLVRRLGEGGMGVVYLAERQKEYSQQVALKLILRELENKEIADRFLFERQILASLQHPNIARLLDGGTTKDGLPYLVMEYVDGMPIHRYCRLHALSVKQRVALFRQVCEAVAFAHRNLVVHRDIKPANILVTEEGVPKLLDFGIAKWTDSEERGGPKTELFRPLTLQYASPEQLAYKTVTTSSDIYSLGILLYELLTGDRPYAGKESDPVTLLEATRIEPPAPSRRIGQRDADLKRRLSGDLDAIVLKALRSEPEDRYPSVEQLLDDLDRHRLHQPVLARRGTTSYRIGRFLRRHRAGVAVALVTLGLLVAVVYGRLQNQRAEQEEQQKADKAQLAENIGEFLVDVFREANPDSDSEDLVEHRRTTRRILDAAVERLDDSLIDQPLERAALLGTLGSVYMNIQVLEQAAALMAESEAIRRGEFGDDAPELIPVLNNQISLFRSFGRYSKAREKANENLRILRLNDDLDPGRLAIALNGLAGIEKELGNYAAAVEDFREALQLKVETYGSLDTMALAQRKSLIVAHNNLGSALVKLGELQEAEALLQQALDLLPEEGLETTQTSVLKNMGIVQRELGELESAHWMLHESLTRRREIYSEGHTRIADALREVAILNHLRGETAQAIAQLEEVMAIQVAKHGEDHPEVGRTLARLGAAQLDAGNPQAGESLSRGREILVRWLSESHPDVQWIDAVMDGR